MRNDPTRYYQAYDIDTDELAAVLRELADGIECGEVPVLSVDTAQDAHMERGAVESHLTIEYIPPLGYTLPTTLLDPDVDPDQGGGDDG